MKAIIAAGPKQPEEPFPKDPLQNGRSLSTNYYYYITQSGLKLPKYWLCYSPSMGRVYCQPCWLFFNENGTSYVFQNPWGITVVKDWRHLSQEMQGHESSAHHAEACVIYEQWRYCKTKEEVLPKSLREKINFWQKVLERLLNAMLMLPVYNLPFCASSDEISKDNKDNFLSFSSLPNTNFRLTFTTT